MPVVGNLTLRDVDVTDRMCQILTNSGGLLSYENGNNPNQVVTQPDVWVHGLRIINLNPETQWFQAAVIFWAPSNTSARLWLTNVHFQHAHLRFRSGRIFVAGVHNPSACRATQTWHVLDRVLVLVVLYVTPWLCTHVPAHHRFFGNADSAVSDTYQEGRKRPDVPAINAYQSEPDGCPSRLLATMANVVIQNAAIGVSVSDCAAVLMEDCRFAWNVAGGLSSRTDIDTTENENILDKGFVYSNMPVEQLRVDGSIQSAERGRALPFLGPDDAQFASLRAVRTRPARIHPTLSTQWPL